MVGVLDEPYSQLLKFINIYLLIEKSKSKFLIHSMKFLTEFEIFFVIPIIILFGDPTVQQLFDPDN